MKNKFHVGIGSLSIDNESIEAKCLRFWARKDYFDTCILFI